VLPFGRRRRQDLAASAVAVLCYQAFSEIRASATHQRVVSLTHASSGQTSYQDWIRMLSDICHLLPAAFRETRPTAYTPTEGLQHAWDTAGAVQKQWIREVLAIEGIAVESVVAVGSSAPPSRGEQEILPLQLDAGR